MTDVLASLVISLLVAYLVVQFARRLLHRCVLLLERLSDPDGVTDPQVAAATNIPLPA